MNRVTNGCTDCECMNCIAKGSILPQIVFDNETGRDVQVTICSSISGGQDEFERMPQRLTLMRYFANGDVSEQLYKLDRPDLPDQPAVRKSLRRELAELLNRHSKENASGTPDFVLANHLISTLEILEATIISRRSWYGTSKIEQAQTNV